MPHAGEPKTKGNAELIEVEINGTGQHESGRSRCSQCHALQPLDRVAATTFG